MEKISVATFNVENFAHSGAYFFGRRQDAPYDDQSFEDKANWIARLIDDATPCIMGFQEIFSLEALNGIVSRSKHFSKSSRIIIPTCEIDPNTGAPRNLKVEADGRLAFEGPNCGLITNLEVMKYESISKFPDKVVFDIPLGIHDEQVSTVRIGIDVFERPVLKARLLLRQDLPVTVFVAHLKSKRGKFLTSETEDQRRDPLVQALASVRSLIVRAAEATALRALLLETVDDTPDGKRGEPVILFGDLNDDVASVTTEIIAGARPGQFSHPKTKQALWDVLLTSVHDIVAARSLRDVAYTHIFDGKYAILDHIHVSQEFTSGFRERVGRVVNTRIFNDHIVDTSLSQTPPSKKIDIGGVLMNVPARRSDHGFVVADIELEPPIAPQ